MVLSSKRLLPGESQHAGYGGVSIRAGSRRLEASPLDMDNHKQRLAIRDALDVRVGESIRYSSTERGDASPWRA
jgi:hypothetical protein